MAQFRVFAPRMRPHIIMAHDLDEAERIANIKYPLWTDIYIVNLEKAEEKCDLNSAELEAATL